MLAYGSHVNAVGAITPDRVEFTDDVFARCDAVVADSVPSVQKLSREFVDYFSDGEWRQITPLSTIVAERRARPHDADLTLFKAMGMGVSDLALGIAIYERAARANLGRPLAQIERAKPRLR